MNAPWKILFLCTHNACRSILAEAVMRHFARGRVLVESAGSAPRGHIHSDAFALLDKHGMATQGLHSKSWNAVGAFSPDVVITVCDQAAGESCPLWLGKTRKVHWGLPDPSRIEDSAARMQALAATLARLQQRTEEFLRLPIEAYSLDAVCDALVALGPQEAATP